MIRRQTKIRTTAPMTAQTIWPYHMVQKEPVAPSLPSSQPPLDDEEPGQPAGDGSEEQGDENVHGIGY